jgi:hypothetical protein
MISVPKMILLQRRGTLAPSCRDGILVEMLPPPPLPRPVEPAPSVVEGDEILVNSMLSFIFTHIPSRRDGASVPHRCNKIIFGTITLLFNTNILYNHLIYS